jgi:hypothetical protein
MVNFTVDRTFDAFNPPAIALEALRSLPSSPDANVP